MQSTPSGSRSWLHAGALAAVLGLVFSACSSSTSADNAGSGAATGSGTAGSGHSGAGASAGTSNSSAGASASAGSAGASTAGSAGSGTAGSGTAGSGTAGSGTVPTAACAGLPISDAADAGVDAGDDGGAACTGVGVETEAVPVDLFMIMDRSQSMGYLITGTMTTRWDAVKAAVQSFASDASVAAIGGGIGFFSKSGAANDTLDCDVNGYAMPDVGIEPLATSGPKLVSAIAAITPGGLTPTVPALQGAINYARSWATGHPGRATVVVLVTDGYPTQCNNDPAAIAAAAKAGYDGNPSIRTYVIGVGDVAKFNLDNYANSGGTSKAYLTDAVDVSGTFAQALLNITNTKIACEYQIPSPPDPMMKIDFDKVQVVYTPVAGAPQEVPKVVNYAQCAGVSNGGWYYDNPDMPTKILVCPCSCANFGAGAVEARLGCKPSIGIR